MASAKQPYSLNIVPALEAHGETAEDNFQKEFSGWLVKFALAVDKNKNRTQAWEELKFKCDVLLLLHHLYLFTYLGKKAAIDVLQDAFRFLAANLDKLIPKYVKIYEDTSTLLNHPKLSLIGVLNEEVSARFKEPMHLIRTAEQELEVMRNWAEEMGSYKTEAKDFHLYWIATIVHNATGRYHYRELARLIDAARIAHGARNDVDEQALKKRVQRYITRMNLPRPRPAANKRP